MKCTHGCIRCDSKYIEYKGCQTSVLGQEMMSHGVFELHKDGWDVVVAQNTDGLFIFVPCLSSDDDTLSSFGILVY